MTDHQSRARRLAAAQLYSCAYTYICVCVMQGGEIGQLVQRVQFGAARGTTSIVYSPIDGQRYEPPRRTNVLAGVDRY